MKKKFEKEKGRNVVREREIGVLCAICGDQICADDASERLESRRLKREGVVV